MGGWWSWGVRGLGGGIVGIGEFPTFMLGRKGIWVSVQLDHAKE